MIEATTARHATDADFDIEVMAQIDPPAKVDPEIALFDPSSGDSRRTFTYAEAIVAARGEEIAALFMNDLALPFE
jgi:hypothetical protein